MTGEWMAVGVAVLWALSALFSEDAGRRIGSVNVNLIRLTTAFLLIGFTLLFMSGSFLPMGADAHTWLWMSLSGLVGFVLGDFFLFYSYTVMDARYSQVMMTLAPMFAAVFGFFLLGESLSWTILAGMLLCITGIGMSVLGRQCPPQPSEDPVSSDSSSVQSVMQKQMQSGMQEQMQSGSQERHRSAILSFKVPARGLLAALVGAFGQGFGIVLSKMGLQAYEPVCPVDNPVYISLAATQIRTIVGVAGFVMIILLRGRVKEFINCFHNLKALRSVMLACIVGPYLGVTLSLMAVQHTTTAVASTIMAMVPIVILVPDFLILKRRIGLIEVAGAIVSVAGVAVCFIG